MDAIKKLVLGRTAEYLSNFSEGRIDNPPIFLQPFLKNGLVFSPKPGRILRIQKSNSVFSYFLDKPGYAHLCELFPDLTFNHESEKWYVVKNPDSESEAKKMIESLKEKRGVDIAADYLAGIGTNFFSSEDFINCYKNPPKKVFGEALLPDESEGLAYNLPFYIWQDTKKVLFQDLSGQINIGNKEISFTKIDHGTEKNLKNELTPYLKATQEIYVVDLVDVKDADGFWTKCRISITMSCDNAFIADTQVDSWASMLSTRVKEAGNRIISSMSCHKIGHEMKGGKIEDFKTETINDNIISAIKDYLLLPEKYFGFDICEVGMYSDVSLDKEDAIKFEDTTKKFFVQEQENMRAIKEQENKNTLSEMAALNKQKVDKQNAETDAAVLDIQTAAQVKRLTELSGAGYSIELEQQAKIVESLGLGKGSGATIVNVGDILGTILKK